MTTNPLIQWQYCSLPEGIEKAHWLEIGVPCREHLKKKGNLAIPLGLSSES
jgi:hypothetical protein